MTETTQIELPKTLSAQIRFFCIVKKMKQKEFVEWLCNNNDEFKKTVEGMKQLNI